MSDRTASVAYGADHPRKRSGLAVGLTLFASMMMLLSGIFQASAGLVALLNDEFFVITPAYVFEFDLTTWGWVHLGFGAVLVAAGTGLLTGRTWARIVGVGLAMLSAIANFAFVPYYPFWAISIVAIDVFVIWALVVHDRDMAQL